MAAKILDKITGKILVVGPVYDQIEKLKKVEQLFSNYEHVIFNGNLCYPAETLEKVRSRIDLMEVYCESRNVIYNLGNYDLKLMNQLEESGKQPEIKTWLKKCSNVVIGTFESHQSFIVTNGGVTPNMTKKDLLDNLETTFVSKVKDSPWHRWYGGAFGYIVSNMPLTQAEPQFYNFSAQIGNVYSDNPAVYALEIKHNGAGNHISL